MGGAVVFSGGNDADSKVEIMRGGTNPKERNVLGMIVNDGGFQGEFNCQMLKKMFLMMGMEEMLFSENGIQVEPKFEELRNQRSDIFDRWGKSERDLLEEQGGVAVVRGEGRGVFMGYESEEDGLDAYIAKEEGLRNGLCGAKFRFGGEMVMRVDVEMAGGSVVTVFVDKILESEPDEDDDEMENYEFVDDDIEDEEMDDVLEVN